ncbi:hypothetical protein HYPSUDRAFT_905345 [Hypholoma sublateritium FD-334 SS-4]|uniref:Secreted protein n=1 Tax=Hypholoma sublateritium (strain FD-334 SS-4) TaxID=945553 RepID=A0A0D2NQQ8_HYPSF|nr:hypothetical protein HYPSUDRAFT_905345 [Hypholoma sublateritium FD-334 SS-4]
MHGNIEVPTAPVLLTIIVGSCGSQIPATDVPTTQTTFITGERAVEDGFTFRSVDISLCVFFHRAALTCMGEHGCFDQLERPLDSVFLVVLRDVLRIASDLMCLCCLHSEKKG